MKRRRRRLAGVSTNKYKDLLNQCITEEKTKLKTEYFNKSVIEKRSPDNLPASERNLLYCINSEENPNWPFSALYIDTIDYNYWEQIHDDLLALRTRYSQLPPKVLKPENEAPKNPKGEDYTPVCDKLFPLTPKIFGLVDMLTSTKLDVKVPVLNEMGEQLYETKLIGGDTPKTMKVPKLESRDVAVIKGYAYVPLNLTVKLEYIGVPWTPKNIMMKRCWR